MNHRNNEFTLLADPQRQYLLKHLRQEGRETVEGLAEAIAAKQQEGDEVTETTAERVQIRLVHTHLPMLADGGVVEYDDEEVALRDEFSTIEPVLDTTSPERNRAQ